MTKPTEEVDMTNGSSGTAIAASNTVDSELISHFADSKAYAQNDGHFCIVNEVKYPLLSSLAQYLLSAPASEAHVEREFFDLWRADSRQAKPSH